MNYTELKIFDKSTINSYIDLMAYKLEEFNDAEFGPKIDFNTNFCLTGLAAAILQEEADAEVKNIIFLVGNTFFFDFLIQNIKSFNQKAQTVFFKEKICVYFENTFIEIHITSDEITTVNINDIYVQDYSQINPLFL